MADVRERALDLKTAIFGIGYMALIHSGKATSMYAQSGKIAQGMCIRRRVMSSGVSKGNVTYSSLVARSQEDCSSHVENSDIPCSPEQFVKLCVYVA